MKILEGADYAIATGCGMAAISSTLFALLRPGRRIIHHRTLYGGTLELLASLRDWQVTVEGVDCTDPDQVRRALATGPAAVIYTEVHSNPLIEVIDIRVMADLAHAAGALLVVDNTFLTPYLFHPLANGADIVLHSATKYLMGHGNGLAGMVCGRKDILAQVENTRLHHGTVLAPLHAGLLHQGIKTLALRMERHCANAQLVAEFLSGHPRVRRVVYPGLPRHPQHAVAKRQVRGFGGMVGFEVAPELGEVWKQLTHIKPWWSLGEPESLLCPYYFSGLTPGSRALRLSVGLEHADDIIADIDQALAKAKAARLAVPILDQLEALLTSRVVIQRQSSGLYRASAYTLKIFPQLRTYTEDGRVPIDSKTLERNWRQPSLNHKNCLFVGLDRGGELGGDDV